MLSISNSLWQVLTCSRNATELKEVVKSWRDYGLDAQVGAFAIGPCIQSESREKCGVETATLTVTSHLPAFYLLLPQRLRLHAREKTVWRAGCSG
jgi:hypothetical protein